jgi:hypothetical protein
MADELIEASDHLHYEFWMLMSVARGLATGITGDSVINNALLESFTMHSRVLLDFLYSESPRQDDVVAEDFFDGPDAWSALRPEKPSTLNMVHKRVGKEIAHLTYARQDVTPETKGWLFIEIANEIAGVFQVFLDNVDRDLLGGRWHQKQNESDN